MSDRFLLLREPFHRARITENPFTRDSRIMKSLVSFRRLNALVQLVLVGLKHIVNSLLRCRFAFAHHFGNFADQEFPRAI